MALLQWLVVLALLGCLCDGQTSWKGPFFPQSSPEYLLQPAQQETRGPSSWLANEISQKYPSFHVPQGLSSSVRPVQLDLLVQNSNNVEPVFEVPYYNQGSVKVEPVRPVLPVQYEQPSDQVSRALHQRQPSAPVYPVQPAAWVPPSVKSQWLAATFGVKVECREDSVLVEVQQDMLGPGKIIQPSEITLGGCSLVGQDPARGVLLFVSELHGCGSTLMVTDSLVYAFTLVYVPGRIGSTPIVRSRGAAINIECRYLRRFNVSSNVVIPAWVPYSAATSAEERLVFSLRFMTDDWQLERASHVYFLGDAFNIEASVVVANHQPLRVFVDSCVATLEPDVTSVPRYAFVGNYGCLTDTKETGSPSQFLPRKQSNKLQMQLEAFRFSRESRNSIYITCILKATMASKRPDPQHKACSYSASANGWSSADGDDRVCGCCDATCDLMGRSVPDFRGKAVAGPVSVKDRY